MENKELASVFGGIFSIIDEYDGLVHHDMYKETVKMMHSFTETLNPAVLEEKNVNWVNSEVLDIIYSTKPKNFWGKIRNYVSGSRLSIFCALCEKGHYECAKWVYQHKMFGKKSRAMIFALEKGISEMVKWLDQMRGFSPSIKFTYLCKSKNLELIQWFLQNHPDTDVHRFEELPFVEILNSGSVPLAEWFLERYPETLLPKWNLLAMVYEWNKQKKYYMVYWLRERYPEYASDIDLILEN